MSPVVPDSYKGAKIEGDSITLDFIMAMIKDFKEQKQIHRRCMLLHIF